MLISKVIEIIAQITYRNNFSSLSLFLLDIKTNYAFKVYYCPVCRRDHFFVLQ